jgi:hypothetical protein
MNRMAFFKPAVPKNWLFTFAGLFWTLIGIYLLFTGFGFLYPFQETQIGLPAYVYLLVCFFGISVSYLFFKRIVFRNIKRIQNYAGETVCLFAFQTWQEHLIAIGMTLFGMFMGANAPIPPTFLAVWIISVGGSMIMASSHYFSLNWRLWRGKLSSSSTE